MLLVPGWRHSTVQEAAAIPGTCHCVAHKDSPVLPLTPAIPFHQLHVMSLSFFFQPCFFFLLNTMWMTWNSPLSHPRIGNSCGLFTNTATWHSAVWTYCNLAVNCIGDEILNSLPSSWRQSGFRLLGWLQCIHLGVQLLGHGISSVQPWQRLPNVSEGVLPIYISTSTLGRFYFSFVSSYVIWFFYS